MELAYNKLWDILELIDFCEFELKKSFLIELDVFEIPLKYFEIDT